MKLRIRGNSIRFRLGQSEVHRLMTDGVVTETTTFNPAGLQRLEYQIVADELASVVAATFTGGGRLVVRVPAAQMREWCRSSQLAMAADQPVAQGARLRILIEKDLECLDAPAEESQADAYPRGEGPVACSPKVDRSNH